MYHEFRTQRKIGIAWTRTFMKVLTFCILVSIGCMSSANCISAKRIISQNRNCKSKHEKKTRGEYNDSFICKNPQAIRLSDRNIAIDVVLLSKLTGSKGFSFRQLLYHLLRISSDKSYITDF